MYVYKYNERFADNVTAGKESINSKRRLHIHIIIKSMRQNKKFTNMFNVGLCLLASVGFESKQQITFNSMLLLPHTQCLPHLSSKSTSMHRAVGVSLVVEQWLFSIIARLSLDNDVPIDDAATTDIVSSSEKIDR